MTVKLCSVKDCTEPSRNAHRNIKDYCKSHHSTYMRNYRPGWQARRAGTEYAHKSGYLVRLGYEHPLQQDSGVAYVHRIVLWDKLEGQDAPCAECGGMVSWDLPKSNPDHLSVDHVDGNITNNLPANLEPVHLVCNSKRARIKRGMTNNMKCEVSYCDRDVSAKKLCKAHYMQAWLGKPFKPIQKNRRGLKANTEGRVCTDCEEFKPWAEFYKRTNGHYREKCKACARERANSSIAARVARNIPCSEDGCDQPAHTKGMCGTHYRRQWARGRS